MTRADVNWGGGGREKEGPDCLPRLVVVLVVLVLALLGGAP